MQRFKLALGFLTVLPVHLASAPQPGDLGRAAVWFPWVGLVLGALLAAARWGLTALFPASLAAVLTVALWAALTGGLHLDGLADCCDGLLAAVAPARRLEIMKDPRLGAFGGAGLVLHLLVKTAALVAIPQALTPAQAGTGLLPLLLAPSLARRLILLAARQPMARPGGLGAEFSQGLPARALVLAALVPAVLAVCAGWRGLAAATLAGLATWGCIRLARARLGGLTGDVLGLVVEVSEAAVLLVFAVV
jgi:adenosylcobinamide-GDP ribazoletransferase